MKVCYLLLVSLRASLRDSRGEITRGSLTLRCRAEDSGCGGSPQWVLEGFY